MTRNVQSSRPFRIVTDRGCNLPPWLARRFDLIIYPEHRLPEKGDVLFVHSSAQVGDEVAGLLREFCAAAEAVGAAASCADATDEDSAASSSGGAGRRFLAVDTLSLGLGAGRVIMEACEVREAGGSLHDVVRWVEDNRLTACQWFAVPDQANLMHVNDLGELEVTSLRAGLGEPDESAEVAGLSEVRGLKPLLEEFKNRARTPYDEHSVSIMHHDNLEAAAELAQNLDTMFGVNKPMLYDINQGLADLLGPGTVGLQFWGGPR